MTSAAPARRLREMRLLIVAALAILFGMVVVEMQGMLALSRAVEEEARRGAAAAAAVAGAEIEPGGLRFQTAQLEGVGVALLVGDTVVQRAGSAGPLEPPWWPYDSRAQWQAASGAVAGPVRVAGGYAMVAYQHLGGDRWARVVVRVAGAAVLSRWRLLGALLALVVAGGGGILALLLIGRILAPYHDLMAEAVRVGEPARGVEDDRFLVDTFRAAVRRLEASEATVRARADELAVLAEVLTREAEAGVVITDGDGLVRACNPRAVALVGTELAPGGPLPAPLGDAAGRLRLGERVVEVRRFPLRSSLGEAQGDVVFFADTTHLDALERALAEREQMASLGEMAAGMAHELRNALATVKGYLRLLPGAGAAEQARYLAAIDEEATSLGELLDRFMSFARPQRLRRERLDVRALVVEAALRVRDTYPEADVEVEGESEIIHADPLALGVIVENLLRNAAEAVAGQRGSVRAYVEGSSEQVRVIVEDSGAGVSEEVRARLFVPFASTKPSGGLGLALARRFARLHGGDVEHEPSPGGGARFVVRLPREVV